MRLLTVQHVSTYRYSEPVALGEHWMMFRPREGHDLRLVSTALEIFPQPNRLRWLHDVFDNSIAVASFDDETTELRFGSTVTLEHFESPLPEYQLAAEAQLYPFTYSPEDRSNLERALERRCTSEDVVQWAKSFLRPSESIGSKRVSNRRCDSDLEILGEPQIECSGKWGRALSAGMRTCCRARLLGLISP